MAATAAAAARRLLSRRTSSSLFLSTEQLLLRPAAVAAASRLGFTRWMAQRPGGDGHSPMRSGGGDRDRAPTKTEPLFPGCDYKHWFIGMEKPGGKDGKDATKQQMIDCYIQTLAKVLGSEEEAKKKIYNVSCEEFFGFGCEIDEETSNKLEGLPGVLFKVPDSYVDPEYKDYGGKIRDESCWSDKEFCRSIESWYPVAKITSEEAALAYGQQTGLGVVTINPGWPRPQVRNKLWHIVDVRDLANALLLLYEVPETAGRHICAPHVISARDLLDLLKSMYPDYPFITKESICDRDHPAPMTSDKLKKLGWSCRPLEETIVDTVEWCQRSGFLDDVAEETPCRFPPIFNKI